MQPGEGQNGCLPRRPDEERRIRSSEGKAMAQNATNREPGQVARVIHSLEWREKGFAPEKRPHV
jgi:hypothetical protein